MQAAPSIFDPAAAWRSPYAETQHDLWTRTNVGEVFPAAVTPLSFSIFTALGERFIEQPERMAMLPRELYRDGRPPAVFRVINGRMYYNTGFVHYIFTDRFGFPSWFWMLSLGGPQDPTGDLLAKHPFRPLTTLRRLPAILAEGRRQRAVITAFYRDQESMRAAAAELRREGLSSMDEEVLIARLERVMRLAEAPEAQLFDGTAAALNAYGILAGLCDRWCGDRALANDLVTGLATMITAQATIELWGVAQAARTNPAARAIIAEAPAGEVRKRLRAERAAAPVAGALDRFFEAFGHRGVDEFELSNPRWADDPSFVIGTLRAYLNAPPEADPNLHLRRQRARRRAAEREARRRMQPSLLHRLLPYRRIAFRVVLRDAQRLLPLRENPKHHFLLFAFELRRTILELAGRLTARDLLDTADDVFFLTREELAAAASEVAHGGTPSGLRAIVAARRALFDRYQAWHPLEVIRGADVGRVEADLPPTPFPPGKGSEEGHGAAASGGHEEEARSGQPSREEPSGTTAASEAISPFPGGPSAGSERQRGGTPQASPRAGGLGLLTGIAASAGVVTGRARVALTADEGTEIEPGEVLVAPFTDPGWTPLFTVAGAVVMDLGGLLSHGAIVAREYGIPAVVNTHTATTTLHTGQLITVDGDKGEVRWEI